MGTTIIKAGGSNASVPAGNSISTTEIDFGTTPVYSKLFLITDPAVTSASIINVFSTGRTATGRHAEDDDLWDMPIYSAWVEEDGSFWLNATAFPGPIVGKRGIYYSIGTLS